MTNYRKLDYDTKDLEFLSNGELKKLADYWLRQYIIFNLKDKNLHKCPLKKRIFKVSKMHIAHFFDRNIMATRYDLNNVHLISEQSNCWDALISKTGYKSLHHYEYEIWLRDKIGDNKFRELLSKSKEITIFAKVDYINVINKFRNGY